MDEKAEGTGEKVEKRGASERDRYEEAGYTNGILGTREDAGV